MIKANNRKTGISMKENNDSIIKKTFSREFNSPKLYMLREEFTTNLKINAKGRVYIRFAILCIYLLFFADVGDTYCEVLIHISLLWLTVPASLILVGPVAQKLTEDEYNLYDILAGIGVYLIFSLPLIIGEPIFLKHLTREYPELLDSINNITGIIIISAAAASIADIIMARRDAAKP